MARAGLLYQAAVSSCLTVPPGDGYCGRLHARGCEGATAYGGSPGAGKSQFLLDRAFTRHRTSFIMRRQYGDLSALIDDAIKLHGSRDGFNASPPPRLRINEDRVIHFRAAHLPSDVASTMGQARDILGIDEATQFTEAMVRFLMDWVRSAVEGQRCRTVLATNPPLSAEGLWFVRMFAPWLDPGFRDPAGSGELRWVVTDAEGRDEWVGGPDDVRVVNGLVFCLWLRHPPTK